MKYETVLKKEHCERVYVALTYEKSIYRLIYETR